VFGSQLNAAFGSQPALAILGDISTSLSGAGTGQSTATPITVSIAIFTTVNAGTGALLPVTPTVSACDRLHVANHGINTLAVYPPSGGKLSNRSANVPALVAPNKCAEFVCLNGTDYSAFLGS
jgi:hypothetical protein